MMKKVLIVIPARLESVRFPRKLLYKINEIPLIQHVYMNAKNSKLATDVIVATDAQEIYDFVESFNGKAILTASSHSNGTERLLEVYAKNKGFDLYINLQGDEPLIKGTHLDDYIRSSIDKKSDIYSLYNIISRDEASNPNNVKVVFDSKNNALYFSRSLIPYDRNPCDQYCKHIGLYFFTPEALERIKYLEPAHLERVESLEQLRWLTEGLKIHMIESSHVYHGVDHQDDIQVVEDLLSH